MRKATECLGEIMSDGHINIPEHEKQLLNWKAGRKVSLIIFAEESAGEDMLKNLQEKGLIKTHGPARVNRMKRRLIQVKGVPMSETVIEFRGAMLNAAARIEGLSVQDFGAA